MGTGAEEVNTKPQLGYCERVTMAAVEEKEAKVPRNIPYAPQEREGLRLSQMKTCGLTVNNAYAVARAVRQSGMDPVMFWRIAGASCRERMKEWLDIGYSKWIANRKDEALGKPPPYNEKYDTRLLMYDRCMYEKAAAERRLLKHMPKLLDQVVERGDIKQYLSYLGGVLGEDLGYLMPKDKDVPQSVTNNIAVFLPEDKDDVALPDQQKVLEITDE